MNDHLFVRALRPRSAALGVLAVGVTTMSAGAQLTLLPAGPQIGTHVGNLVTNGSFELPGSGPGTLQPNWITGASAYVATPPGWTSSGSASSYGVWGRDGGSPFRLRTSDILPDGGNALYFGNGQTAVPNSLPTFNPNGEVTFAGTPGLTSGSSFPSPVVLFQTITLPAAPSYILSFWASGEGSGFAGPGANDGIFGLSVSNTQPGDPTRYFAAPAGGSSPYGASMRYEFSFTPINPSLPVTIRFLNWGHVNLPWGGSTELVLDDVIVNAVPTPGAGTLVALAGLVAARRRR